MRPGEITPVGQSIVVAPAAIALQSHATQVMVPLPSTSTCPPRITWLGNRRVPVMSFDVPLPLT
jgi:hypothetical protein